MFLKSFSFLFACFGMTFASPNSTLQSRAIYRNGGEAIEDNEYAYTLATNPNDLRTGDEIIFVAKRTSSNKNYYYSPRTLSNNILLVSEITKSGSNMISNANVMAFTVVREEDGYRFMNSNNKYLAAASNQFNYCALVSGSLDNNSLFSLTYSSSAMQVVALGNYSRNRFQYSYNNGSNPRFTCYENFSATSVNIYKKASLYTADEWAKTFLSSTSDGYTCNVDEWEELSTSFKALPESVRNLYTSLEADSSTSATYRAQAVARYDFFMSDSRFNNVEHFIENRISSNSRAVLLQDLVIKNDLMVIITIYLVSIASLSGLILFKRRKRMK